MKPEVAVFLPPTASCVATNTTPIWVMAEDVPDGDERSQAPASRGLRASTAP